MDKEFTKNLQDWLNTPAEQRDLEQGATYLLQLTNNKILYRNITRDLKGHAEFLEFKIKRYLEYRLQQLTHEEVQTMQEQVNQIVVKRGLDRDSTKTAQTEAEKFRRGKRLDHDTLPEEIQALYVENASILQKMRELHLQLRNLSTANTTCPDSDRYPFLTEIIKLDKMYHNNWLQYDRYVASAANAEGTQADSTSAQQVLDEAARLEQKNILRQINLSKGRYKKNPTEALKEQILSLYKQLTAPSDKLTAELKELGLV